MLLQIILAQKKIFIKKISKRYKNTGQMYLTYRLVKLYKINGQPHHETINNLKKQMDNLLQQVVYNKKSYSEIEKVFSQLW